MNPHFIFNSLNSINYFILNNNQQAANSFIADFSRLIGAMFNHLDHNFISFAKELELIRNYLRLEHLRFEEKFNYSINIQNLDNHDQFLVPPGLIQPLVENAIWHGLCGLTNRKGTITIRFTYLNAEAICCIIEDNGVGRTVAERYRSTLPSRKSRGMKIVSDRIRIMNRGNRDQYSLKIEDLFPDREETGTRVTLIMPILIK